MDLALHARVLWRNRLVVVVGFLIALALAFLAFVRVTPDGLSYRQDETWTSTARLFASAATLRPSADETDGTDPTTFAVLLAEFINSDAVMRTLERNGPVDGQVEAAADQVDGEYLPIIGLVGMATTPAEARRLARRATAAIQDYAVQRQNAEGIRPTRQIQLEVINKPGVPQLLEGRSKTLPVIVLFGVMSLVLIFVYVRENIRQQQPERRTAAGPEGPHPVPTPVVLDPVLPAVVGGTERPEAAAGGASRWSRGVSRGGRDSARKRGSGDSLEVQDAARRAEQGKTPYA